MLAVLATGCVFAEGVVPLGDPAFAYRLRGGAGRELRVEVPFADARAEPGRCGARRLLGVETAALVCSEDPTRWLALTLAAELRRAGFTVTTSGPRAAGSAALAGTLDRLFASGGDVALRLRLVLTAAAGSVWEQTFEGTGEGGLLDTQGARGRALDAAAEQLAGEVVRAVIARLDESPADAAAGGWALPLAPSD